MAPARNQRRILFLHLLVILLRTVLHNQVQNTFITYIYTYIYHIIPLSYMLRLQGPSGFTIKLFITKLIFWYADK
jgi:hypothetical protein